MISKFKTFLRDHESLKTNTINQYAAAIWNFLPSQLGKYDVDIPKNISSYTLTELEALSKRLDKGGDLELIGEYGHGTIRAAIKKFVIFFQKEAKELEVFNNEDAESNEYLIENFRQESELQDFIHRNIDTIFPNYHFFGRELRLNGGKRVDFILEANDNSHLLIIELKANAIDKKAFAQISEYLVLAEKEFNKDVRGLLIGTYFEDHIPDLLKTSRYKIDVKKYQMKVELK